MERMEGRHTAEQIRVQIQNIVNRLEFEKGKIVSVTTDEDSNFCRLFKQKTVIDTGEFDKDFS